MLFGLILIRLIIRSKDNLNGDREDAIEGIVLRSKLLDLQKIKSLKGSGGDYLSNEIFYRVAKLRSEQKPVLSTGHLHIPLTQESQPVIYERGNRSTKGIHPKIGELINKIKEIISKI